ncbi:MAG: tRNA ((46)-N7)-methyltransferase TrmB [Rhizobacter sp.]|nr:tRNA ((46)-N7)-methyltransferase TrmB [Rhizobacter sp.]
MPNPPDLPEPSEADAAAAAATAKSPPPSRERRPIKSFVLRTGRITSGQTRAMEVLGPKFVLPYAARPLDFAELFGRSAPTVLEIGFGMGEATAQIAATLPDHDFIGCEVHEPGVGALLMRIENAGLTNLRLVQHDAVEVLAHMISPASLAGIHIFFPDPWHKKRHNKRRLINASLATLAASRLAPGGYLHCATDWQPYAEQIREVLAAEPALANTADGYAPKPAYRPLTKFENRGIRLGHGVWDVVFRRAT